MKTVVIIITLLFILNINLSAIQTKKPDLKKLPKYESLLKKVLKGSKEINFFDLRMSFTQSKNYKPANPELDSVRKKMIQNLNSKEYEQAIILADSILKQEFIDMYAHYTCYYAYTALGDSSKAFYHEFLMDRLLNSVVESGDGKTKESAFLIINSNEEYFLIYIYKLKVTDKSFTNLNGEPIDVFKAVDSETNDSFELYFNTSMMIEQQKK
ncbi:MAG: DUF4919 domain-containing protein [Ignavibacteriae bacterium]|nr:DUF4919 domain-containing protein [Ignavibacteriota bacterium]